MDPEYENFIKVTAQILYEIALRRAKESQWKEEQKQPEHVEK